MAEAIHAAIERNGVLVAEAGTGTGKTFAYLVPALLSGGKVIISTGTKTLQDQLFDRDLPAVSRALACGGSAALLKGRANYVCVYRLRRAAAEARLPTREQALQLRRIERFAAVSDTGDRADLADVPEDAPVWAHATSTRENCLGQSCPDYGDCFVMRARRNALAADVVVVNHHLFFADVALRDEGIAELLPACNTVIFDEAHQLAETARLFFGETVSSAQLVELARDARLELRAAGGASPELDALAGRLEKAARDLRLSLGEQGGRLAWGQALRLPGFSESLRQMEHCLRIFREPLEMQAERSEGLESCARRAGAAAATLARLAEVKIQARGRPSICLRKSSADESGVTCSCTACAPGSSPPPPSPWARRSTTSRRSSACRRKTRAAGRARSRSRARRSSTCPRACPPIPTPPASPTR